MEDIETFLSGIDFKVRKLLNLQKKLKTENSELLKVKNELLKNIELLTEKLKESEEKNKVLRISKKIDTGENTKDIRLKINEIVREVDKCVSLLSR